MNQIIKNLQKELDLLESKIENDNSIINVKEIINARNHHVKVREQWIACYKAIGETLVEVGKSNAQILHDNLSPLGWEIETEFHICKDERRLKNESTYNLLREIYFNYNIYAGKDAFYIKMSADFSAMDNGLAGFENFSYRSYFGNSSVGGQSTYNSIEELLKGKRESIRTAYLNQAI